MDLKKKLKRNFLFIIFFIFLLFSSSVSSEYWHDLTIGQADNRYCRQFGFCDLNSLTVDNLTVENYINATVIYFNVTGGINKDGEPVNSTPELDERYLFQNGSRPLTGNWSTGNHNIGINVLNPLHNLDINGDFLLTHTATSSDEHGLELKVDAAGFGDVKGIDLVYTTGAIETGDDEGAILIGINKFLSTGGDVFGVEVLSTEGSADVWGYKVGAEAGAIHQDSGIFVDMDSVDNNGDDHLAEFITTNSNVTIFASDNDYVTIGDANKFEEIEFILNTEASVNTKPDFEYSTGEASWDTFSPVDGTNGFEDTGIIAWEDADIPTWDTSGGEYLIRITRTKNNINTNPIEGKVQISAVTEYYWDKNGDLLIRNIKADNVNATNGTFTDLRADNMTLGHPTENRGNPPFWLYGNESNVAGAIKWGKMSINDWGIWEFDVDDYYVFEVDGISQVVIDNAGLEVQDDRRLSIGGGRDYWFVYDTVNTQLNLTSTDIDGGGTDGTIMTVDDGTAGATYTLLNVSVNLSVDNPKSFKVSADAVDFNQLTAIAMVADNGATLPTCDTVGQWFLHTPTGRNILYMCNSSDWQPIQSIGGMDLYVGYASASDDLDLGYGNGNGESFATIQFAIDTIPGLFGGDVVIHIDDDVFDEDLIIQGKSSTGAFTITFDGDMDDKLGSRTVTASGDNTVTIDDGGAAMTPDAHIGQIVRITGGGDADTLEAVIYDNTETVITIIGSWMMAYPKSFVGINPEVDDTLVVEDWAATVDLIIVRGGQKGVILHHLLLNDAAGNNGVVFSIEGSSVTLAACKMDGGTTAQRIIFINGANADIYSSYLEGSKDLGVHFLNSATGFLYGSWVTDTGIGVASDGDRALYVSTGSTIGFYAGRVDGELDGDHGIVIDRNAVVTFGWNNAKVAAILTGAFAGEYDLWVTTGSGAFQATMAVHTITRKEVTAASFGWET